MRWFGFGFNAFGQIYVREKTTEVKSTDTVDEVKVSSPAELTLSKDCCLNTVVQIKASWSRRASLQLDGDNCVHLTGFGSVQPNESCGVPELSHGSDVFISEAYLTLGFSDKIEVWDLQKEKKTRSWSMEIKTLPETSGSHVSLPLVPGGYIAMKPPFYRPLSQHLKAKSLALSAEHAILLTASGDVYTWGQGSHGQLGHGGLSSEEEPRAVEALLGMPMSSVAAGGWHSACISDGGDLYVWGWNETGQLGLPSRGLRKAQQQQHAGASSQHSGSTPAEELREKEENEEVFISIQAFPALVDVTPSCEVQKVSCGHRHTAALTTTGELYTWGWGDYGQLGHQSSVSSDEPQCVEFFREKQMRVIDVVCGAWNTFAAVVKMDVGASS
ncbi:RCC1 domain-containing protein 1 [Halichoeres trimaculatus]|uniref:RCC1 domain-containing protein 1 n=1 Tax=Halichoeres trimaculatus TaxID=147232 RepID=UPI003D9F6A2F